MGGSQVRGWYHIPDQRTAEALEAYQRGTGRQYSGADVECIHIDSIVESERGWKGLAGVGWSIDEEGSGNCVLLWE